MVQQSDPHWLLKRRLAEADVRVAVKVNGYQEIVVRIDGAYSPDYNQTGLSTIEEVREHWVDQLRNAFGEYGDKE